MTRLSITDLLPDTQFAVRVRAVGPEGVSQWSNKYNFTSATDNVQISVPQNVTWVVVDDAFYATWDPVTTNVNNEPTTIQSYQVSLLGGGDTAYDSVAPNTDGNSYTLSFANNKAFFGTPEPTVEFQVRAVDNKGLLSDWSLPISASNPVPSAPASATANALPDAIAVNWTAVSDTDVVGYDVHVGTTAGFTPTTGNKVYSGLGTSFTYYTASYSAHYFKVRAIDKFGQGSAAYTTSNASTPTSPFVVDTTAPAVVTGLGVTFVDVATVPVSRRAVVAWTAPADTDLVGYYVRYRKSTDANWRMVAVPKTDTNVSISGLEVNTAYDFSVRAYDRSGNFGTWVDWTGNTGTASIVPSLFTAIKVGGGGYIESDNYGSGVGFRIDDDSITVLNGSIKGQTINTGQIISNQTTVVNGVTVPAWSINLDGYAVLAGASILGNTILGNASGDTTTRIQSYNYVAGTSGWMIRADGTAELAATSIRGSLVIGQLPSTAQTAVTNANNWSHPSDTTKIDGGDVYTGTITANSVAAGAISTDKLTVGTFTDSMQVNPNFEDWNGSVPIGWTLDTGAGYTGATYFKETASPISGTASLRAVSAAGGGVRVMSQNIMPALAGQEYYASMVIRCTTAATTSGFGFYWYDAAGTLLSTSINSISVGTNNTRWENRATAPVNAVGVRLVFFSAIASRTFYMDQSVLAKGVTGSLLVNGAIDGKTITGVTITGSTQITAPYFTLDDEAVSIINKTWYPAGFETDDIGGIILGRNNWDTANMAGLFQKNSISFGGTGGAVDGENWITRVSSGRVLGRGGGGIVPAQLKLFYFESALGAGADKSYAQLTGDRVEFNVDNGFLKIRSSTGQRGLMNTDLATGDGAGISWQDNKVAIVKQSYSGATLGPGNTQTFHALDIHSQDNGIFMEDLAGGGVSGANINNAGRIVRTSTMTIKEDIQEMTQEEAYVVLGLKSYTFKMKESDGVKDPRRYPGFIAEQGAEAGAELWVGRKHKPIKNKKGEITGYRRNKNGEITSFRTEAITVAHNVIIKDQQEKIVMLEERLAELEQKFAKLTVE